MYKSRKIILFSFIFAAVIMLTAASVRSFKSIPANNSRTAFFANNIVSSEDDYKTGYYLSVNKGYLAVFYNNDVIYTSNIKVENLRNVDREMLEDGIKAESYEEVLRMLEDFGS